MVDRTQLIEALGHAEHWVSMHTDTEKQVMAEAARILLDFPTDEMVEHGAVARLRSIQCSSRPMQHHGR